MARILYYHLHFNYRLAQETLQLLIVRTASHAALLHVFVLVQVQLGEHLGQGDSRRDLQVGEDKHLHQDKLIEMEQLNADLQ